MTMEQMKLALGTVVSTKDEMSRKKKERVVANLSAALLKHTKLSEMLREAIVELGADSN